METCVPKKRPVDVNKRAKLIVDIAIGEVEDKPNKHKEKKAIIRGQKGGFARARALSAAERKHIAIKAARKRWRWDES